VTTSRNPSSRAAYPNFPLSLDVTTDQTINEGDMVWWDSVNGTLKPLTATTAVAVSTTGGFCGCALGSNFAGGATGTPPVYPAPAGTTLEQASGVEVQRGGTVFLFCTAGEFYSNYTAVTVGATAQTISVVGVTSTNRVGWVVVEPPSIAQAAAGGTPLLETITGTGQLVEVLLEAKFPNIGIF
jgi:hypothetical protein